MAALPGPAVARRVPWLTGLASATSAIRLGMLVASPNFRHPVTFTKEPMTLDRCVRR
jgi:alkanesulfonate monooxygenase SsuD/methylene tetrahydromethanopterin reductase-like flavin-dependent oxidoreductase (luciferase family)